MQAVAYAVEAAAQGHLSRIVRPVRQPDGDRRAAELLSNLDHAKVVLDGLASYCGARVAEGAELVAVLLSGLVLEGVRVHRIEAEAEPSGVGADGVEVPWLVPGDVQGDAWRRAGELLYEAGVFHLLEQRARLALAGEATEARAAGGEGPRRECDLERLHLRDDRLRRPRSAIEAGGELDEVAFVSAIRVGCGHGFRSGGVNEQLCSNARSVHDLTEQYAFARLGTRHRAWTGGKRRRP